MKKTKISKSISLYEDTIVGIHDYPVSMEECQDFSYKVNEMAKLLISLRRHAKKELVNYFTLDEACAICEICKNLPYVGEINPKSVLYGHIEDACMIDQLDKKWNIDKTALLTKIDKLSTFQTYTVISNVYEFRKYESEGIVKTFVAGIFLITE